jgi:SH3-like domain-containing protein
LLISGCSRFKHNQQTEVVYVLQKQAYLRDRVAAVSNRVGVVQNGDRLDVIEHGRRFLKVRTAKGEIGWIEDHAVVNPEVVTGFQTLQTHHQKDPVIGTAVLRDDGYLHLKPGRDTERYYLLPEGDKLQLMVRASVPKLVGPQAPGGGSSYANKKTVPKAAGKSGAPNKDHASASETMPQLPAPPSPPSASAGVAGSGDSEKSTAGAVPVAEAAAPVPMEDWWLVRDSQGKVGWVMSRRIDVDVPDEIAGYAEGQRIVGAYILRKVNDPDSNFPDKQAPEYVAVFNPYQDGLPYDFNQVRVFTWNLKKHRYEGAYRQRNLQGYLPVTVSTQTLDKAGPVPVFEFKQGIGNSVTIDAETGATHPTSTETLTFRLDGALVKRVLPAPPAPPAKPAPAVPSAGKSSPPTQANEKHGKRATRAKHHHRKDAH